MISVSALCAPSVSVGAQGTAEQERVLAAATALAAADRGVASAYRSAAEAYTRLKSIEVPDFVRSLEAANREAQSMLAQEMIQQVLEKSAQQAGARGAARAIPYIGLAADLPEMYRLLKLDAKLVPANLRSNLTNLLVLRPAAKRYEQAANAFNGALASQTGAGDRELVTISYDGARLLGRCAPNWSGRATVQVSFVQGGSRRSTTAQCAGGQWSTPVAAASYNTPSAAYATLSDGRSVASATRVITW